MRKITILLIVGIIVWGAVRSNEPKSSSESNINITTSSPEPGIIEFAARTTYINPIGTRIFWFGVTVTRTTPAGFEVVWQHEYNEVFYRMEGPENEESLFSLPLSRLPIHLTSGTYDVYMQLHMTIDTIGDIGKPIGASCVVRGSVDSVTVE